MMWFIAAVLLFVAEMFIGTFYLLVISASFISAGLAEWLLGTSTTVNISIASVFSIIGIFLVRRWQKSRTPRAQEQTDDDLDLGQTVVLAHALPDGLWLVRYRGTEWQAQLDGASAHSGDKAQITGRHGNVLRIALMQQHSESTHSSS